MGGAPGGPGMGGFGGPGGAQFHGFHGSDPFKVFEAFFGRGAGGRGGMSFSMGGEDDDDHFGGFGGFGGGSPFGAFGGRGGSTGRARKQPDAVIEIGCSLEDLYNGVTKTLRVTRNIVEGGSSRQEAKTLSVEIKPGYKAGTKIRYEGEGDSINGAKQDIVFVIKDKPHQYYERDGDNLVYNASVTLQQALTGIKMTLPTLDNRSVEVYIRDQVITPNYTHRIPNEGMPKKGGGKGDMLVKFNVRFPVHLNDSQREQIKAAFKGCVWQ